MCFFNDLCVLCDEGDDADSSVCTGRVPEAFTTHVNNPNKRLELVTIVWSFLHLFHKLILSLFLFLFALLRSWKRLLCLSRLTSFIFLSPWQECIFVWQSCSVNRRRINQKSFFVYSVLNNKLSTLLLACDPSGAREETPGLQSQSKAEIDGEKNETLGSINHHRESEVFGK